MDIERLSRDPVAWARAEVEDALNNLKPRVFAENTQLTFIMRVPGNTEAEMVITNDDLSEVAKVIKRTQAREKN